MLKLNTLHGERNGKKRGKKERKEGAVCVRSEGRKGMGGKIEFRRCTVHVHR